jgi:hypothetical protein
VQVWVDGITMNNKSLINFSSSLTLRYSSKELNFNSKQQLGFYKQADEFQIPHQHKALAVTSHFIVEFY